MQKLECGVLLAAIVSLAVASRANGQGVLRVHPGNPRYFTDDSGRAVYLAGHQWFNDVQHNAWNAPVTVDWARYLQYMRERKLNYLRNWVIWSVGDPTSNASTTLMPFKRTGPGTALDGKPKFDLCQFDQVYFDRLRTQISAAEEEGIFVSLMLFEVYGFMDLDTKYPNSFWAGNMFHGPNNRNGIDTDENGDRQGLEFFFSSDERVLSIQQSYVKKVIDSVNEFDNVFYEIANELKATQWQNDMVRFIKEYELTKPKQHLVYVSPGGRNRLGKWSKTLKKAVTDGPADVYSVMRGWNRQYRGDPPIEPGVKPVIMDMDHVAADNDGDNDWNNVSTTPWKLFTRGYHQCIYDHDYWKPGMQSARWQTVRFNIGMTRIYADKMNLAKMQPRNDLCTTRYCLADPGREYLVFRPGTGTFTVGGLVVDRRYQIEWYQVATHQIVHRGAFVAKSARRSFEPPFGNVVLYISTAPPTATTK